MTRLWVNLALIKVSLGYREHRPGISAKNQGGNGHKYRTGVQGTGGQKTEGQDSLRAAEG